MSKNYFISFLLMGLVFSGCTNQCHELTEQRKSQIEKQILAEWEKISIAIENSDSEEYATFISPDLILMSSGGSVFYSKTAYIDSVRNWFSTRKNTEIQQEKVIVTVIAEDIVLLDQESVFQVSYKDGNIQHVHHAVSLVFKKGPSAWMIIHGHESFSDIE